MRQQINLYQPIFSESRKGFTAGVFGLGLLIMIAALSGYSWQVNTKVKALRQQVETVRAQQTEQEALLAQVGEQQATRAKPAEIDARVKRLQASLNERTQALKVLQSGAAGQTTGFAPRMEALARQHVEGLWIDGLLLSGTNGSMTLTGATLNADVVPTYLQGLSHEAVLSGTRFDEFVIEAPSSSVEPVAAEEEGVKPKVAATNHIRFRAGSKQLSDKQPESAT
jgi:hypothetical protein